MFVFSVLLTTDPLTCNTHALVSTPLIVVLVHLVPLVIPPVKIGLKLPVEPNGEP